MILFHFLKNFCVFFCLFSFANSIFASDFPGTSPKTPPTTPPSSPSKRQRDISLRPPPVIKKPKSLTQSQLDQNIQRLTIEWSSLKSIGEGHSSDVYLRTKSKEDSSNSKDIVKIFKRHELKSFYKEIKKQEKAGDYGIAPKITDVFYTEEFLNPALSFSMEYFENSETLANISLSQKEFCSIADKLLDTLIELHKIGITHNDMAPENLLIQRTSDGFRVFIIDFGSDHDDPGHPQYHIQESLQVSYENRDLYSLAMLLLEKAKISFDTKSKKGKPSLNDLLELIERSFFSQKFKDYYLELQDFDTKTMEIEAFAQENDLEDVPHDGSCFYHCLLYSLGYQNSDENIINIKNNILQYIQRNEQSFQDFFQVESEAQKKQNLQEYIENHRKNHCEWADEIIIQAAAKFLACDLIIYQYVNSAWTRIEYKVFEGNPRKIDIFNYENLHFLARKAL